FLDSAFVDDGGRTTGLRPGAEGEANGETVRVDARGFHVYAGNAGLEDEAVWLWLGDSVTFGVGVAQDATVAGRIAARQDTALVLNPSVLGWGTADYRRRLQATLEDGPRPARVTLVWCLNDADPSRPSAAGEVSALEDAKRKTVAWLNVNSRLYRLAKDAALDRPLRYYRYDRALYQDARLDSAWTDLEEIVAVLEDADVPLEVVVVPYEPQLRDGGDRLPQEVVAPRLRALGVLVLDLYEPFLEAGDAGGLYLWSDGIHLSKRGHGVAADAIARWRPRG
ncbi:SGNH/GDSL hydrolase family protein, partial [Rubrivirga sp.]|uniref:SGNH/GDSL hydrolase family protein n=1 Tax=Rubrivirga sp. TaxID=1885344 RepID=UPI003C73B3EA